MSSSSSPNDALVRNRILSSKLYFDVPPFKVSLIYSESYDISFLRIEKLHPFDSSKWGRICRFLVSFGVLDKKCIVEPLEASKDDLLVEVGCLQLVLSRALNEDDVQAIFRDE